MSFIKRFIENIYHHLSRDNHWILKVYLLEKYNKIYISKHLLKTLSYPYTYVWYENMSLIDSLLHEKFLLKFSTEGGSWFLTINYNILWSYKIWSMNIYVIMVVVYSFVHTTRYIW